MMGSIGCRRRDNVTHTACCRREQNPAHQGISAASAGEASPRLPPSDLQVFGDFLFKLLKQLVLEAIGQLRIAFLEYCPGGIILGLLMEGTPALPVCLLRFWAGFFAHPRLAG